MVAVDLLSVGGPVLAFVLVLMNGFFVAAEFAFVRIRPTQVNALVEDGTAGATSVRETRSSQPTSEEPPG